MKLLMLDSFHKSIPVEKKREVNERMTYLIKALNHREMNLDNLPTGLDLKKIQGISKKIYKFKVNGGDRILCARTKDLHPDIESEYENSLILLEYCSHDTQIRIARGKNYSADANVVHEQAEEIKIVKKDRDYLLDYHLNAPTTSVQKIQVEEDKVIDLFGEESRFYYLDQKQKQIVHHEENGQFVFGSAGSGKTTISVYKIIQFLQNHTHDPNARIAYFTHSKKLKDQTQELFFKIAKQLFNMSRSDYEEKVSFHTVEEYIEENADCAGNAVTYEQFKEWYIHQKQLAQFDPIDLWKERRGILQGMIGADWQYAVHLPVQDLSLDHIAFLEANDWIDISPDRRFFLLKKPLHHISATMTQVFSDADDFKARIIERYNERIIVKKSLLRDEYFALKDRDTIFLKDERSKAFKIFENFDVYMGHSKTKGLYEEGELVRRALVNVSKKYEYIVIDEVQDLTEIQIYYLYQLLKKDHHVFVCGDFHQTINPTFFHVGRIESIFQFLGGRDNFIKNQLETNYRSSQNIVRFANEISTLRQETITTNHELNYTEHSLREETFPPYLYTGEKEKLLVYLKDKSYVYIVVGTEESKQNLLKSHPFLESRLMTVSEVKGIENKYIVMFNIFSDFHQQWRKIFERSSQNKKLKSEIYRYYFNLAYVAVTRARDTLGMIEDNLPVNLEMWLKERVEVIVEFNLEHLRLTKTSTHNETLANAKQLEASENFSQAIATYRLVIEKAPPEFCKQAEKGVRRCEIKQGFKLSKDYAQYGVDLLKVEEYEEAIPHLRKSQNEKGLVEAILSLESMNPYKLTDEIQQMGLNVLEVLIEMDNEELTQKYIEHEITPFIKHHQGVITRAKQVMKR